MDYTTYGIPYMGSKKKLIPFIFQAIDKEYNTVLDLFTGTTRVAQAFRQAGKEVYANDLSAASLCYGALFLELKDTSILQPYLDKMNSLEGYEGWFTQNYHGDQTNEQRGDGRFMQYKNTVKVDAARDYVESLEVSTKVKRALIGCILLSFSKVDNTLGQQQAYLKEWCSRSYNDINFSIPGIITGKRGTTLNLDGFDPKLGTLDPDLVYLDPPYSRNVNYSTYYHIYDSVAMWDKPATEGKARRRYDRTAKAKKAGEHHKLHFSDNLWYAKDQTEAFVKTLDIFPNSDFLISYSSDSSLSKQDMMKLLSKYGEVTFYSVDHKTNVLGVLGSSTSGNKIITPKGKVKEYLFIVKKSI